MRVLRRHPVLTRLILGVSIAAVAILAAAVHPDASAGQVPIPIPINPVDALKGLIGGPADLAGKVGASALAEALEWLLGGVKATITLALVKFLVHIDVPTGRSLVQAAGPLIVIGGFFLVVGLITSIADGYREVIAGTDTATRVIGQAIFRIVGLALLLGSWYWIVPLATDLANGMSDYVLASDAVSSALRRSFATESFLKGVFPLLGLITAIGLACSILVLVVLKFMMSIAFACMYVGGPALIGFAALPRVGGAALSFLGRGLVVLTIIPLAWTVVFAAWAGVSAGTFDALAGGGGSAVQALMGPGLFLAGMLVILGVTRKLLALATFGVQTTVPGSRLARYAISAALIRKAFPGAGGKAPGPEWDASGQGTTATPTGGSAPRDRVPPQTSDAAGPTSATSATQPIGMRPLPVHRSYDDRAARREASRSRRAHDSHSLGDVEDGVWRNRRRPEPAAMEELRAQIHRTRAHWKGEVPDHRLREASDKLPRGDRSAFAAAARTALDNNPADHEGAWREFRETGIKQYAGRTLEPQHEEAVSTMLAASPETVWNSFSEDYKSYGVPSAAQPHSEARHGVYDERSFEFNPPSGHRPAGESVPQDRPDAPTERLRPASPAPRDKGDSDAPSH